MKKVTLCVHQRFCQICISQNEKKKQKNNFAKVVYSVLVVKMCWQSKKAFVWALMEKKEHQSVRLEKRTIKFENYFKKIKSIKITFLVVLLTKLFVLMISLPSQWLFLEVKMLLMNLLKQFLKSMNTVKKVTKTKEEEEQFQSSNTCHFLKQKLSLYCILWNCILLVCNLWFLILRN